MNPLSEKIPPALKSELMGDLFINFENILESCKKKLSENKIQELSESKFQKLENQILIIKEFISSIEADDKSLEWFNKKVIDLTINGLSEKPNTTAIKSCEKIRALKFIIKSSESTYSPTPLICAEEEEEEVWEEAGEFLSPNPHHSHQSIEDNPIPLEPLSNHEIRKQWEEWYQAGYEISKAGLKEEEEPVNNWYDWLMLKSDNFIGYLFILFLKSEHPWSPKFLEEIDEIFLPLINPQNENNIFKYCDNSALVECQSLLYEKFLLMRALQEKREAEKIICNLRNLGPLRSVIIHDLKNACFPIMRYLAGYAEGELSHEQIIEMILEIQTVLRRYGFIEIEYYNHNQDFKDAEKFNVQSDPTECLHALDEFLQKAQDQYSHPNKTIVSRVTYLNQDETSWECQNIQIDDENEETENLLFKLGKNQLGIEVAKTMTRLQVVERGKEAYQKIIHVGQDALEAIEDVPSIKETLKSRTEKFTLDACIITYSKEGKLLRNNDLTHNIFSLFNDINSFTGYRIKDDCLQKVIIPVLKRSGKITFVGKPPQTLLLTHAISAVDEYETNKPVVSIPKQITFCDELYKLSSGVKLIGDLKFGHYKTYFRDSSGTVLEADSLTPSSFTPLFGEDYKTDLHDILSSQEQVTLIEYKRQPKRDLINKLYQTHNDSLCYIIQMLYCIYDNERFSAINLVNFLPSDNVENETTPKRKRDAISKTSYWISDLERDFSWIKRISNTESGLKKQKLEVRIKKDEPEKQ